MADKLVTSLNVVGAEFGHTTADRPLIAGADRLAARLMLDALVADLYGLHPDDFDHVAAQFPIYDKDALEELRYPRLAVVVYRAMAAGGVDAARRCANDLVEKRRDARCGFGFDELWQPEGGWEQANIEAREILQKAGLS